MNDSILVATDGREGARGALRTARWLAERDSAHVEVLAVYEPAELYVSGYPEMAGSAPPQIATLRIEALRARVRTQLEEVGGEAPDWPITVRVGHVAPTIARFAAEKKVGLILVGLRQPRAVERWLGREAMLRLVHLAHAPVFAVTSGVSDLPRNAIVATDFSDFSVRAAHEVLRWMAPAGRLHLVHICWAPLAGELEGEAMPSVETYRTGAERRLEELASELEKEGNVNTRVHVLAGEPAREILRLAEEIDADLITSGSHGAGFFGRLVMGSVSSRLVHGAECALLIVPPQEVPAELLQMDEREMLAELGTSGDLTLPSTPA